MEKIFLKYNQLVKDSNACFIAGDKYISDGDFIPGPIFVKLFDISHTTMARWIDKGNINAVYVPKGTKKYYYVDLQSVENFAWELPNGGLIFNSEHYKENVKKYKIDIPEEKIISYEEYNEMELKAKQKILEMQIENVKAKIKRIKLREK